jgi:hypothetical protein
MGKKGQLWTMLMICAELAGTGGSVVTMRSPHDVDETINCLEAVLRAEGVRLRGAANGERVKVALRAVQALIRQPRAR